MGNATREKRFQEEAEKFYRSFPGMTKTQLDTLEHPILAAMSRELVRNLREEEVYSVCIPEETEDFGNAMLRIYQKTGSQFVILIDEWDCVFRNYEDDRFLQDKYIDWLRGMFKDLAKIPVYALVYMMGILPIKRYNTQSAMNNFREYSMIGMSPLEEYTGFTWEETAALYQEYGMDAEKAKEWYDGYQLGDVRHIYNPNSVVESIHRKKIQSYWTATGTYEAIKSKIDMNFDGLKDKVVLLLGNERCKVNVSKFENDMVTFRSADDVLTLLVHLGYLGYDSETGEAYIPNREIRMEFCNAIEGEKWINVCFE